MASQSTILSIVVQFLITFVNPRKSWDKITPEFPLAPRRDPEEIALDKDFISGFSIALTSRAAAMIVMHIFVPVSPSGTGNTFNSLIHSCFASRFLAPAKNIFARSFASNVAFFTISSSLVDHSDSFYKNIDLFDLHARKRFYFIFYSGDQVVRYSFNVYTV